MFWREAAQAEAQSCEWCRGTGSTCSQGTPALKGPLLQGTITPGAQGGCLCACQDSPATPLPHRSSPIQVSTAEGSPEPKRGAWAPADGSEGSPCSTSSCGAWRCAALSSRSDGAHRDITPSLVSIGLPAGVLQRHPKPLLSLESHPKPCLPPFCPTA